MTVDTVLERIYGIKKALSREELYEVCEITNDEDKSLIDQILEKEVKSYNLIVDKDKYIPISRTKYKKGSFDGYKQGGGKVTVITSYLDDEDKLNTTKELYIIKNSNSKEAIDGDEVLIEPIDKDNYRIKEILSRKVKTVLGEVFLENGEYFIKSNDKRKQSLKVLLDEEEIVGSKVIVSLEDKLNEGLFLGKVKRVIGSRNSAEKEFIELAYKLGIEPFFSDEALEELEFIPNQVSSSDKEKVLDLTDLKTFTIDGKDTKDMDDAVSIRELDNGNFLLGVHIANPTYYIEEGSYLDQEAILRGTSVYAFNQVIPMLPPKISNGICSLNPDVERLCLSSLMEIDKEGKVLNFSINEAVIKSRKKMNYDDVNSVLEGHEVPNGYEDFVSELRSLYKLALILKKRCLKEGMINIDMAEPSFYKENGKIEYKVKRQKAAEDMIEFLMVTANEQVARYMKSKNITVINRIHEAPNSDKIRNYVNYLKNFGISYNQPFIMEPEYFQELIERVNEQGDIKDIVLTEFVRSLKRACYSIDNLGHFALGKSDYVHFTSPIRRGPDYILHRQIRELVLSKRNSIENRKKWALELPSLAERFSKAEQKAAELERIAVKRQACYYMRRHVGDEYKGIITSLEYGYMNVELENLIEGRIKYEDLDSHYVFNEKDQKLFTSSDRYMIGDKLDVIVKDSEKAEDFNIYFDINKKIGYNDKGADKQKVKQKLQKYYK
ncbi:MAG: VacB/RNase II family 3'-5' exoribonuclease [Bacilli bacterium]|nr:VacB/RNase II family 3'-5' exoribonuclease [Bacilli bacterium]